MGCIAGKPETASLAQLMSPPGRPPRRGMLQESPAPPVSPPARSRRNRTLPAEYEFDDIATDRRHRRHRDRRRRRTANHDTNEQSPDSASPTRKRETTQQRRQRHLDKQKDQVLIRQTSMQSSKSQSTSKRRHSRKSIDKQPADADGDSFKLTAAKVSAAKKVWMKVADATDVQARFYKNLLGRSPEVKEMFRGVNMTIQGQRLWKLIGRLIGYLPDLQRMAPELRALGKAHKTVRADHFHLMNDVLVDTLQGVVPAAEFSADVQATWKHVIQYAAEEIQEGALTAEADVPEELDDDQRAAIVKENWGKLSSTERVNLTEALLQELTNMDGDIKKMFKNTLKPQARKLAAMFTKLIEPYPDLLPVMNELRLLGAKHADHGVDVAHFELFAQALQTALERTLGGGYSKPVSLSWADFIDRIGYYVKGALKEELGPLNVDHVKLIRASWGQLMETHKLQDVGATFYKSLFAANTALEGHMLSRVKNMQGLQLKFMECIGEIVAGLDDFDDKLVPMLEELAKKHVDYGAEQGHYVSFADSFVTTLQSLLGIHWTTELHSAWSKMMRKTCTVMMQYQKRRQKQRDKDADKKDAEWMYDLEERGGMKGSGKQTWAEIKKHTTRNDCWIVVRKRVYDVTKWLAEHPGGADAILRTAGKDATAAFDQAHSGPLARGQLGDWYIAELS